MNENNNIIAVFIGIAIITVCVIIFLVSQSYFRRRANQSKVREDGNNDEEIKL
jgi:multisubunit Na+/H+ antiporter MnhC subunit